ncbi:MAG TPA: TetR/AcrR family transcriptional regulator [Xanthobacteraceae bacterium]|jgi:AcrR family transcriptional regulator
MARKPGRKKTALDSGAADMKTVRERIIHAFMRLLAEKPLEGIGLDEIASRAEITLADLRANFSSSFAILAAHVKEIDRTVLGASDDEIAEEPPRERLFDVLMRRLEALEPHKAAIRSLLASAARNPPLALALNSVAVRSQQWMLAAAGISTAGPRGLLRAQGLALLFAPVLRTWLGDDDPGHARTMAALDRALGRGQSWSTLLDGLCSVSERLCRPAPRRRNSEPDEGVARRSE